jgi:hypothetical protein
MSTDRRTSKAVDSRSLERSINRIRGVYASQIVLDPTGNIEEIHVLASPLRKPKQIVRDIESMLLVSHGIRVDYRRVSLVQMEESRLFQAEARPKLVAVHPVTLPSGEGVEAELEIETRTVRGFAAGPADGDGALQTASNALLDAVEQATGSRGRLRLSSAQVLQIDSHPVVLVLMEINLGTTTETLLGSSLLRDDPLDAAARATLDAINRRLPILRPPNHSGV